MPASSLRAITQLSDSEPEPMPEASLPAGNVLLPAMTKAKAKAKVKATGAASALTLPGEDVCTARGKSGAKRKAADDQVSDPNSPGNAKASAQAGPSMLSCKFV